MNAVPSKKTRVYMVQPVVPAYRVPLFEALAALPEFELNIHASPSVPDAPDSVRNLPSWMDTSHQCVGLFGNRLLWQKDLELPADFGRGDVFIFNGNPRFVSSAPLFLQARSRGIGTLWWGHSWSPTSVQWRARIRYRLMSMAAVTLLYTDEEVAEIKAAGNWQRPLVGLNNTLDTSPMTIAASHWSPKRLDEFRSAQGITGRRIMLFCGRLRTRPSTELDVALQAMRELRERDPRWLLVVVGTGEDEPRMRSLAKSLGVEGNVLWKGPLYDETALAPWFLSAECFVYPGPIGLSVMHAFAYGLPVITHSIRRMHNPEITALREGKNGGLFERGNPQSLAAKVEEVCNDPARRQLMSENAMSTIRTEFSFESMVGRFASAIRMASRISLGEAQP